MRYLRRIGYSGTPTYHALAGQLAKSDDHNTQDAGGGLLAVDRAAGASDPPDERSRRCSSQTPTRESWLWSLSALTKVAPPWPSPIDRSGRTPTQCDSRSTTCACSRPTLPNGCLAHRGVPAADARPSGGRRRRRNPLPDPWQRGRQRVRRQHIAVYPQGTRDPGAHRRRRRPAHVRAWRCRDQHRRGTQYGGRQRIADLALFP